MVSRIDSIPCGACAAPPLTARAKPRLGVEKPVGFVDRQREGLFVNSGAAKMTAGHTCNPSDRTNVHIYR